MALFHQRPRMPGVSTVPGRRHIVGPTIGRPELGLHSNWQEDMERLMCVVSLPEVQHAMRRNSAIDKGIQTLTHLLTVMALVCIWDDVSLDAAPTRLWQGVAVGVWVSLVGHLLRKCRKRPWTDVVMMDE